MNEKKRKRDASENENKNKNCISNEERNKCKLRNMFLMYIFFLIKEKIAAI